MKTQTFFSLFLLMLSLNALGQQTSQNSKSRETKNKEIARKIFQAFDTGDADALDNLVAKDAISHMEMHPNMTSTGLDALKEMIKMQKASFPDMRSKIHVLATAGDTVMAYYTTTGTNTGQLMGMPATNKTINVEGVDIMLIRNGKAVEHWGVFDSLKMMQQLGLAPSNSIPPAPPASPTSPAPAKKNNQ
jgi:steroid delta-isomerase-like uncharacterized protein